MSGSWRHWTPARARLCALSLSLSLLAPVSRASSGLDDLTGDLARGAAAALGVHVLPGEKVLLRVTTSAVERSPGDRPSKLRAVLERSLVARLGQGLLPTTSPRGKDGLEVDARARGAVAAIIIDLSLSGGYLHAVGELVLLRLDFWSRVAPPAAGAMSLWYARARLDGGLRHLLELPAGDRRIGSASFELGPSGDAAFDVLATAIGDFDGDDLQEVALVGRTEILVTRVLRDGENRSVERVGAGRYASRLTTAPLQPLASAIAVDLDLDGQDELVVWSADAGLVSPALRLVGGELRSVPRRAVGSTCGTPQPSGAPLVFCGAVAALWPMGARLGAAGDGTVAPLVVSGSVGALGFEGRMNLASLLGRETPFTVPAGLWAWTVARDYVTSQGATGRDGQGALTAMVDANGRLALTGGPKPSVIDDAGLAALLVDLDDDGSVELIRTTSSDPGTRDAVIVHDAEQPSKRRFEVRVPSVLHLSSGDADNDGVLDVLVTTSRGLWALSAPSAGP